MTFVRWFVVLSASVAIHNSVAAVEYRFYHPDPLGSNVVVTDRSGNVVQRTVTTPYGETRSAINGSGQSVDPSANSARHLFTGQEQDPESGLQYFGTRHYDPFIGRFMNIDPVLLSAAERGLPNAYAYVDNRPTRWVDPTGLEPERSDLRENMGLPPFDPDDPMSFMAFDPTDFVGGGPAKLGKALFFGVMKKVGKKAGKKAVKKAVDVTQKSARGGTGSTSASPPKLEGVRAVLRPRDDFGRVFKKRVVKGADGEPVSIATVGGMVGDDFMLSIQTTGSLTKKQIAGFFKKAIDGGKNARGTGIAFEGLSANGVNHVILEGRVSGLEVVRSDFLEGALTLSNRGGHIGGKGSLRSVIDDFEF